MKTITIKLDKQDNIPPFALNATETGVTSVQFSFPVNDDLSYYIQYQHKDGTGGVNELDGTTWVPNRNTTATAGMMKIQLFGLDSAGQKKWLSEIGRVLVTPSLDPDQQTEVSPSQFEQWLNEAQQIMNEVKADKTEAETKYADVSKVSDEITAHRAEMSDAISDAKDWADSSKASADRADAAAAKTAAFDQTYQARLDRLDDRADAAEARIKVYQADAEKAVDAAADAAKTGIDGYTEEQKGELATATEGHQADLRKTLEAVKNSESSAKAYAVHASQMATDAENSEAVVRRIAASIGDVQTAVTAQATIATTKAQEALASATSAEQSAKEADDAKTSASESANKAQEAYDKAYDLSNARCGINQNGELVIDIPEGATFSFAIEDNSNLEVVFS